MANVMLMGVDPGLQALVNAFAKQAPTPAPADVETFLKMLPFAQWKAATEALIIAGVPFTTVEQGVSAATQVKHSWVKDGLTLFVGGAAAFHGIRRNDSLFMGAWWFLLGVTFPVATSIVAVAQGFGKAKKKC